MTTKKIRVLIVDDSFFMRTVIGDILRADADIDVVGEAKDGVDGLQKIKLLRPDVVTLDVEMPVMDGVETLQAIVSEAHHPSVVMVSGYVQPGANMTLECLSLGAADFIVKPSGSFSMDMDKVKDVLRTKVKAAAMADTSKTRSDSIQPLKNQQYVKTDGIVVIGASTGGPAALEFLLPKLPSNFPCPVVVAQHLPKEFTELFVGRLQKTCTVAVAQAKEGLPLMPGTIYIAAGSTTTTVKNSHGKATFDVRPNTIDIETPSISKLMSSAVQVYGGKTIGVILTGMGTDGSTGMLQVKEAGGTTIVQDEATSAVYGMGREVIDKGLADEVMPLAAIPEAISRLLQ